MAAFACAPFLTRVYAWDGPDTTLSLRFGDFVDGNAKFETLKRLLAAPVVRAGWDNAPAAATRTVVLRRPTLDEVKKAFLRCHKIIWKAEKMSPQASFVEFAKLLFVKLWEDRKLRDDPDTLALIAQDEGLPVERLRFTTRWIGDQEENEVNPVGNILFRQLVDSLQQEIAQRKRKRIFERDERLDLNPGTIKRVVAELERYYLFGIDEDLKGRMFEAFLTATMRGQALGQYFTPRSVVKVMTQLAGPVARKGQIDRVLDACCGTGGFLIEALTEMRAQVYANKALTRSERGELLNEVANEAIFGIDAGRDPPIARVARINMYLHGDGGSRIYVTDGLRRVPRPLVVDPAEVRSEVEELRALLESGTRFDIVLTNPPFSMDYSANDPEELEILNTYELRSYGGKPRPSLRSSVMFIEQYWRLLKPSGRLLTVIDDSVLGGDRFAFVRDFIRERFIIRAVVSLHGDAFQRSGARAKTSILYLTRRQHVSDPQPAAFVFESRYIGLDDVVPRTPRSVAEQARETARAEMEEILREFRQFEAGQVGPWLVPPERLTGRLDAKYLRPWSVTELSERWSERGIPAVPLASLVDLVEPAIELKAGEYYEFLTITYEGRTAPGERRLGEEVSYARIGRAQPGDIIVSNISAVYRAICVMPPGLDHLLISNEFTVLRLKKGVDADPHYLWSVLRSAGVIAEWLSGASGVGRHRVKWETLRGQLIPLLPGDRQAEIGQLYRDSEAREAEAALLRQRAVASIADLDLEGDAARDRLARAKPPK